VLILDSNTISYYFRGDPQVVPRLQALRPADLGVPAIVEYELRYGLLRLPEEASAARLAALTQLMRPMQRLPFDSECAEQAAQIRAKLEVAGTPMGPHDTLIAATVLRHQGTLVTRNLREFARVPGLHVLNWHQATGLGS
jgi:tRNA(fMet)-specific endonuclease VapC